MRILLDDNLSMIASFLKIYIKIDFVSDVLPEMPLERSRIVTQKQKIFFGREESGKSLDDLRGS